AVLLMTCGISREWPPKVKKSSFSLTCSIPSTSFQISAIPRRVSSYARLVVAFGAISSASRGADIGVTAPAAGGSTASATESVDMADPMDDTKARSVGYLKTLVMATFKIGRAHV